VARPPPPPVFETCCCSSPDKTSCASIQRSAAIRSSARSSKSPRKRVVALVAKLALHCAATSSVTRGASTLPTSGRRASSPRPISAAPSDPAEPSPLLSTSFSRTRRSFGIAVPTTASPVPSSSGIRRALSLRRRFCGEGGTFCRLSPATRKRSESSIFYVQTTICQCQQCSTLAS